MPGTRTPPSHVEPLALRNGVYAASGHVSMWGPLSEERKISVRSSWPVASSSATRRPHDVVQLEQRVLVRMARR